MDDRRSIGAHDGRQRIDPRPNLLDAPDRVDTMVRIPNVAQDQRCRRRLPRNRLWDSMKLAWEIGYRSLPGGLHFKIASQRGYCNRDCQQQMEQEIEATKRMQMVQSIFLLRLRECAVLCP